MRVFIDDSGLIDYTIDNEAKTGVVIGGTIYIAQETPFNHVFVQVDTPNEEEATVTVEHWDGSTWRACVDILDATANTGIPLTNSGHIQWQIDEDYSPSIITNTKESDATVLQGLDVYNRYWFRLSYDTALTADTEIKSFRYQFTNSQIMKGFDIELDTYLSAFATGKTDWFDEISTASDLLIVDLKRYGLAKGYGSIIDFNTVSLLAAYRTLSLIYFSMGTAYVEKYKTISGEYERLLTSSKLTIDTSNDAKKTIDKIDRTYRRIMR